MKLKHLLFLIVIPFQTFSQKNFLPGYIIYHDQVDTIKLKINFLDWEVNPKSIEVLIDNVQKELSISELNGFGIYNIEYYTIKKCDIDLTPYRTEDLLKGSQLIIIKDTLIALRFLVKADNSLLYFKDDDLKEHYYIESFSETFELINHKYLISANSKWYYKENQIFKNQLEKLFDICDKKIETSTIRYNPDDLTEAISTYNECMGCGYLCYYKKNKDKTELKIGFHLGYNFENKNFHHRDYWENIDNEYIDKSSSIAPGINFQIGFPRKLNRSKMYFESYYSNEKIQTEAKDYNLNLNYVNFSGMFKNSFGKPNKFNPYWGIGISTKVLLLPKSDRLFENLDTVYLRGILETGATFKDLEFFIRAKANFAQNNYTYLYKKVVEVIDRFDFKPFSFQFGMNYYLISNRE